MKKVLAWVLLLTLVLGAFAGCKKEEIQPTEPAVTQPADTGKVASANDAIEYLKGFYKDDGSQTPVDYTRFGIVRVGGVAFDVVWTVDVGEDLIKVVVNDDGTVTIDINEECPEDTEYVLTATVTDAQGNTVSHSWNHILPKAQDMVEIVKAAYALAPGESLPYESRLIGKIISIDSIWSDEYQNITVSIEITGAEDMPIKCYRMKGNDQTIEQIKDLKVGNIITVRGTLKNYEGTIEFDAGCILEKVEKGDAIDAPTDPGEILKAAYALPQDKALPYQATLTGTVIEIDTPYDPAYGNISVVIEIEGYPQYPILCYRLKGTGVDQIAIKDLITVTGIIKNYKGTIEYDAGCIMTERVSGGGVAQGPSSDAAKILSDAAKLGPGEKLPYRATLTGEVYSIDTPYSSQYNNITVTMKVNGVKIQCYRMVGDGIDQIRETDTITVSGVIENYNGKLEFGAKSTLDSWSKGPRNVNYGPVAEDVAYRLYLNQTAIDKVLYFNGDVSGTRLQTSDKGSKGADVFAERVSGKGVRFFYMDGQTKTYIEIEEYLNDKGQARGRAIVTENPTCYWAYISDLGVYAVNLPTAGKYFLGSYSTYETITASWCGYIDGTMSGSEQFVAKFMKASDVPADDTPPASGAAGVLVTEIQAGVPYKWGIDQKGLGSMLYFNGEMAKTYYGGTVESINNGVDVVLEEVPGGGYYLSFTVNGAKKYVNVVVKVDGEKTHRNFAIDNSASTVYTYNSEHKTLITPVEGVDCYLGTYGSFNTFSISTFDKISNSYPSHFYTVGEGGDTPDTPVDPEDPSTGMDVVTDPVAGTAYKFGMIQENVGTDVYYITGEKANYYMATTTDVAAAADVYLEATNGGYYLYTDAGGAKKYINMVVSGTHVNGMFEDAASTVYTYDAEKQTVVATVDDALYWFGTRNDMTYTTIGPVKVEYEGFYAKFYAEGEGSQDPSEPEETEPEVTEPAGDGMDIVTDPVAGTAYKFGMIQENVGTDVYYITGEKANYYMATTTDVAAAADVYLEATNGGYYLYTDASGAKKYINMVVSGTHVNGMFEDAASTVYTYDAEKQTVVATVDDALYWFGTRNDMTYTTIGPVKVEYEGFYAKFYAEGEGSENPSEPEETEPEEDGIVAISEALKASSGTFTVKGVVTLVDSSNIYVQDSTGAICVRMASKPTDISLGDTIIGTGSRADYNGMPQLGSGTYEKSSGMTLSAKETTLGALTTADICTYVKISGLTVTEVYDSNGTYSLPNITVEDSEGNSVQIYKAVVGKTNGAWDVKVGDTINVCAAVGYFNKFQLRNTVASEIAIGDAEPEAPTGPSESEPEETEPEEDDNIVAISEALKASSGTFTVKGVVTLVDSSNIYVQDSTGAICVRMAAKPTDISLGDTIIGTGSRADYNGMPQLGSGTYEKSSGMTLSAKETTLGALTTADICTYVKISGLTVTEVYDSNGTYSLPNITVEDSEGNSIQIYKAVVGKTNGAWDVKVGDTINVCAAVGYFNKFQLRNTVASEIAIGDAEPDVPVGPSETEPEASVPDVNIPEGAEMMAVIIYDPATSVAMTALSETFTYGYLPKTDITIIEGEAGVDVQGATEQNVFFLIDNGDETTVKIMDCYGRYLYMTGTYNSFNVSKEIPASGADWAYSVNETQDGMYLTNLETKKTVGYSAQHGSFGVYPEEEKHTALRLIQIVFEDEEQPEETEPETGAETTVKYTFSDYEKGVAYGANEVHKLDELVTVYTNECHFTTQLRLYQDAQGNGTAVFECAKAIKSVVINAGHRQSDLEVYGSVDGENWVLIKTVAVNGDTNVTADYTVEMPAGTSYKYLKLDAVSKQIRIPYITFTFGE